LSITQQLSEIIKYYNDCSRGLGGEFLNEFEKQILKIAAMPTRWMTVETDVRRALMKRFPFVIYFRILENDTV
jgi:toxin ParE1/3/4